MNRQTVTSNVQAEQRRRRTLSGETNEHNQSKDEQVLQVNYLSFVQYI